MTDNVDSQKTKDILTCPICLERFTKPKSLPCLHTFCEFCIMTFSTKELEKLGGKNHINCPVCRTTVQLPKKESTPKEFVDQMPTNFLINELLEKEDVRRPVKLCMSCEKLGSVSPAIFICIDCFDTLCETCQKYHKSNKASSNHDIKPISTLTDETKIPKAFKSICSDHSKKLKLFCNDHDVPCCILCVSLNHRKCDNVVTIEEEAKKFCADVKLEKLQMDIRNVSNDFDTLLSHYSECSQSNAAHYEDKQKMIEISFSTIISKFKALEITRKAELKKLYEEKTHILEDRIDTCTNYQKTVVSYKQTLEENIEKASEVQVMFEAQKIAGQVEKHKQLLKKYKFDGSKVLISGETGIPILIDVFINSLFKISVSNEDKILKLLTDESSASFNSVQKSTLNQSVGDFLNPDKDIKIKLQEPIFGTSPAALNLGTVNQLSSTPTTSASTEPHKQLANSVSIVTSIATGSSAPKGTFSVGQQSFTTGSHSTFSFGKVASTTPTAGQVLLTSPTKACTTTPSPVGNICIFPQKENIIACELSNETSLVKSPLRTSDGYLKPVIDLSDFVGTKTGKEEEEAVFCEQATLFRFDNGQWKVNTIVELKLLRHKQTKRVLLLMRRNQVIVKHFLTKEMKLSPMQSSKMAWCWNVHFQSKGKSQITKIAVCFKGENRALKFKATFEKMQSELDQVQSNQVKKEPAKTVNTDTPSLGSMFKKEEGSWSCPKCLVSKKSDVQKCAACQTLKPGLKREDVKQTESNSSNIFGTTSGVSNFGHPTQTRQMPPVGFFSQALRDQALQSQQGQIMTGQVGRQDPPLMSSNLVSMSKIQSVNSDMYPVPQSIGGFNFENTTSDQQSPGFSSQLDATPKSATDIKFGQTTKADSKTPATVSGIKFDRQTVSTVKTTTADADIGNRPLSGGLKLLPDSAKKIVISEAVSVVATKSSTFEKKTDCPPKPDQFITEPSKSALSGFTFQQTDKPSGFGFGGDTKSYTFKPASTFTFGGFIFTSTKSDSEQNKPNAAANGFNFTLQPCVTSEKSSDEILTTVVPLLERPRKFVTEENKEVKEEKDKIEYTTEEDEADDDKNTADEEEEILFVKNIIFSRKENDWKAVGLGTIKVMYDEDVNGYRVIAELNNKNIVCNHLLAKELNLSINKKECSWSPIETTRRHFRAQFSSEQAAQEFQKVFEEGRQLAQESDISERYM